MVKSTPTKPASSSRASPLAQPQPQAEFVYRTPPRPTRPISAPGAPQRDRAQAQVFTPPRALAPLSPAQQTPPPRQGRRVPGAPQKRRRTVPILPNVHAVQNLNPVLDNEADPVGEYHTPRRPVAHPLFVPLVPIVPDVASHVARELFR